MSGGSYEYLCVKDAQDIHAAEEQLERMAERLSGLGYADEAADETKKILAAIREFQRDLQFRLDKISEVWRGIEWWDSGDRSEQQFKQVLERYLESLGPSITIQGLDKNDPRFQ